MKKKVQKIVQNFSTYTRVYTVLYVRSRNEFITYLLVVYFEVLCSITFLSLIWGFSFIFYSENNHNGDLLRELFFLLWRFVLSFFLSFAMNVSRQIRSNRFIKDQERGTCFSSISPSLLSKSDLWGVFVLAAILENEFIPKKTKLVSKAFLILDYSSLI